MKETTCVRKLFGERIALNNVKEPPTGATILLPDTVTHEFRIAEVVKVGDMKVGDDTRDAHVEVGDMVMFQMNAMQHGNARYNFGNEHVIVMPQGDLIAKLIGGSMDYSAFVPVGKWVILSFKQHQNSDVLFIPEKSAAVEMPETFSFHVEKVGAGCNAEIKPGQEVIVERNRCNQLKIEGTTYLFVSDDWIYGAVSPDRGTQTEKAQEEPSLLVKP